MSNFFSAPITTIAVILSLGLLAVLVTDAKYDKFIRGAALFSSLAALAVGLVGCLVFDKASLGFQSCSRLNLLNDYNFTISFGLDGLGFLFTLLTLFVFPICFLASWGVTQNIRQFIGHLLIMELLLVLTFTTTNLLYFFIFFESLLIPMFILIGKWGSRERRIKAAYYFFLYTLFGSLFMLFGLFYLYFITGSMNYSIIFNSAITAAQQQVIWFCFFLAFAVKMPLFPVHIWLPEAHVEAPTVGSMLLASLLLKLGGYGFLRFSIDMLKEGAIYFAPHVSLIALLGVIYGSLNTIRQIDMKRVIAYSSVAHMNLVMLGLFSYAQQGLEGAIYLMVAHGIVSTALFFAVGVLYDRHHTRLFRYYGGLVVVMPLFATAFFAFTLANMSFPGTSNFLGELLIFVGLFNKNSFVLIFASTGIVLAAVYSIWLYNRVCFGTLKTRHIRRFADLNLREVAVFFTLLFPMLLLGLISSGVLDFVHLGVHALLLAVPFLTLKKSTRSLLARTSRLSNYTITRAYMSRPFFFELPEEALNDMKGFRKVRFYAGFQPATWFKAVTIFSLILPASALIMYYINWERDEHKYDFSSDFYKRVVKPVILALGDITSYIHQWSLSICVAVIAFSLIAALWYALSLWRATIRLSSRMSRFLKAYRKKDTALASKLKRQYDGLLAKAWFDIQQYVFCLAFWIYVAALFSFILLLDYTFFGIIDWYETYSHIVDSIERFIRGGQTAHETRIQRLERVHRVMEEKRQLMAEIEKIETAQKAAAKAAKAKTWTGWLFGTK